MFSVYLITDKGEDVWVYTFPTRETAEEFMKENNVNNLDYVIREEI